MKDRVLKWYAIGIIIISMLLSLVTFMYFPFEAGVVSFILLLLWAGSRIIWIYLDILSSGRK